MSSRHFKFDLHCAAGQEAANFLQQVLRFQEASLPAAELFTSRCSNDYLAPVLPPILFAELCQNKLVWKIKPFSLNKIGRHFSLKSCHRWNNKSTMGFQVLTLYCIAYGRTVFSPTHVHVTSVTIYDQKSKDYFICPKFHRFLFAVILISYLIPCFYRQYFFLTYRYM